jgi:hypothetical protein
MSMTQDNGFCLFQVDSQDARIIKQSSTLAGIENDLSGPDFYPEAYSMLRKQRNAGETAL